MTVTPEQIALAQAAGLTNVEALAAACDAHGFPFYLACTILAKETGGRNIYGHDKGGALSDPTGRDIEVTEANYRQFRALIDAGHTSNGVGPMQLTWRGFFPDMEKKGLKPWLAADNILYGVGLLSAYYGSKHDFWATAKAYNGGVAYADDAVKQAAVWLRTVGDADTRPAPDLNPTSDPIDLPGVTMGNLAYNIKELSGQNGGLPHDIQLAAAEILTAAEKAGHHVQAVSWYNPASTPEHHVPGFAHEGGVAVDFMIYGNVSDQDFIDNYAWANRGRLGICWQISRRRIRSTSPGHSGNWGPYSGPSAHTDHTHMNFGHLAGQSGYGSVPKISYRPPNGPAPKPGPTHPSTNVVYLDKLHPGQTDSDSVRWLQYALVKLPGNQNVVPITGTYDAATVASVKLFQKAKGDTTVDGDVGPNDMAALLHDAGISNVSIVASSK